MDGRRRLTEKSTIRSVRLSKEVNDLLEKDAKEQRLSFNGLVNRILQKYVEWDRFADRFGFVSLTSDSYRKFLDHIDDKSLESIGKELGTRVTPQTTIFWQNKFDFQGFLKIITLYSRYSGQFNAEMRTHGSDETLTFHHSLGEKYSIFLQNFIDTYLTNVLGNSEIKVKCAGNLVVAYVKLQK